MPLRDEFVDLYGRWLEAASRGDRATVRGLLGDGCVLTDASGTVSDRETYLRGLAPDPALPTSVDDLAVRMIGNVALLTGRHGSQRFTGIWQERNEAWRCQAHQTVNLARAR